MRHKNTVKSAVKLRRIPYPYRAMIAICSDLDETRDLPTYLEIAKFLNTTKQTRMGRGVGLEVGNSIYFYMPRDQFSYWSTDEKGREIIRTMIHSGHIDCLHSYGDLAENRRQVYAALNELTKYDCRLSVWVDHGQAPTNFGPDIMQGRGDIPGDSAYHADLTISYGVKYVWLGRVTSIVGQEAPWSLAGIWNLKHPLASFKTLSKELAKGILAAKGNNKYSMHFPNKLVRATQLRDGQEVFEFMRSTFHWGGISFDDTAMGMKDVLTKRNLDLLVRRNGFAIIYTHLGKLGRHKKFSEETVKAFQLLKKYEEQGDILITTTYRILNYIQMTHNIAWSVSSNNNVIRLDIKCDQSAEFLQGLTFYMPKDSQVEVFINGKRKTSIQYNPSDYTGRPSMSIPWKPLSFPKL